MYEYGIRTHVDDTPNEWTIHSKFWCKIGLKVGAGSGAGPFKVMVLSSQSLSLPLLDVPILRISMENNSIKLWVSIEWFVTKNSIHFVWIRLKSVSYLKDICLSMMWRFMDAFSLTFGNTKLIC